MAIFLLESPLHSPCALTSTTLGRGPLLASPRKRLRRASAGDKVTPGLAYKKEQELVEGILSKIDQTGVRQYSFAEHWCKDLLIARIDAQAAIGASLLIL